MVKLRFSMNIIKKILNWASHWEKDKILHFLISMIVALFTAVLVRLLGGDAYDVIWYAWIVGFIAGMGKELYDKWSYDGADDKDWGADVLGTTVGMLFAYLLTVI